MEPLVIIYDGNCKLCQGSRNWIISRSLPGRFEFLSCQSRERRKRFPQIAEKDCMSAIQLITSDGSVYVGADAIPLILHGLKGWRILAYLFRFPLFTWMAPRVYGWVARHRHFISCVIPFQKLEEESRA